MENKTTNEKSIDSFGSNNSDNGSNNYPNGKSSNGKRKNKYLEIAFMSCVSGAGLLFGFSTALASAKKKDSNAFDKGITMARVVATETGGSLAMRALLWGTVYACTGFGLICLTVWKAMDVKDLQEFRQKAGNFLPRITPKEAPTTRTEFSSIRDLLEYIIEESDKSKEIQKKNDKNNSKEE